MYWHTHFILDVIITPNVLWHVCVIWFKCDKIYENILHHMYVFDIGSWIFLSSVYLTRTLGNNVCFVFVCVSLLTYTALNTCRNVYACSHGLSVDSGNYRVAMSNLLVPVTHLEEMCGQSTHTLYGVAHSFRGYASNCRVSKRAPKMWPKRPNVYICFCAHKTFMNWFLF